MADQDLSFDQLSEQLAALYAQLDTISGTIPEGAKRARAACAILSAIIDLRAKRLELVKGEPNLADRLATAA